MKSTFISLRLSFGEFHRFRIKIVHFDYLFLTWHKIEITSHNIVLFVVQLVDFCLRCFLCFENPGVWGITILAHSIHNLCSPVYKSVHRFIHVICFWVADFILTEIKACFYVIMFTQLILSASGLLVPHQENLLF